MRASQSPTPVPGYRAVFAAVLVVALLATGGVAWLRHYATAQWQAIVVLSQIQANASALSSLEWQTMVGGRRAQDTDRELAIYTGRMSAALIKLKDQGTTNGYQGQSVLEEAVSKYQAAVDEEFRLLRAGDVEQGAVLDSKLVDPAYGALDLAVLGARSE